MMMEPVAAASLPAPAGRRLSGERTRLPVPPGSAAAAAAPAMLSPPSPAPSPSSSPSPTNATATRSSPASSISPSSGSGSSLAVPRPVVAWSPFLRCQVTSFRSRVRAGQKTFSEFQLTVTSPALHWDAYKRYSEFAALHKAVGELIAADPKLKALQKAGKLQLPKLPPAKLVGNLKEDFLVERRDALNTYLNDLLSIEQLHTCRPVLEFLGALESSAPEAVDSRRPSAAVDKNASATSPGSGGSGSSATTVARRTMPHLHLDALLPLLDAGDVVLFRTSGALQSLQRTFTGSRYDHVGMVIRIPWSSLKPSSLHLLESTSDGVRTYQLARRMRAWHMSSAVVVVRQLKHVRRTDAFLSALDSFVSDVDGLPYGLTLGKLLRRHPGQSRDTFFCSELIATAYMRTGLLSSETHSATEFFPSDFNEHNSTRLLALQHGAELGPELRVDFVQPAVLEARENEGDDDDEMDEEEREAVQAAVAARLSAQAAAHKRRSIDMAARRARDSIHYSRPVFVTAAEGTHSAPVTAGGSSISPPVPIRSGPNGTTGGQRGGVMAPAAAAAPMVPEGTSVMQTNSPAQQRWRVPSVSVAGDHSYSHASLALSPPQAYSRVDRRAGAELYGDRPTSPPVAEEENEDEQADGIAEPKRHADSPFSFDAYMSLPTPSLHAAAAAAAAAAYASAASDGSPVAGPDADAVDATGVPTSPTASFPVVCSTSPPFDFSVPTRQRAQAQSSNAVDVVRSSHFCARPPASSSAEQKTEPCPEDATSASTSVHAKIDAAPAERPAPNESLADMAASLPHVEASAAIDAPLAPSAEADALAAGSPLTSIPHSNAVLPIPEATPE